MKKILGLIVATYALWNCTAYAQKIKSDDISYFYNRLPAVSVDKSIKNYQVTFDAAYEAKNQEIKKNWEQAKNDAREKLRTELAEYPGLVKAADVQYNKEMAEYNKKSLGSKILESAAKPVKRMPAYPQMGYVPDPVYQSTYDYKALAGTYVNLEGYQNTPANALKIVVTLYGFDHTQPRNMDEQAENISIGGSSNGVYKATNYHVEFSYRHPMAVKVYTPEGKELLNITPPELNSYKIYKSRPTSKALMVNSELLLKTAEESVLQENLKFINNLLNDKFGFASVKRKTPLYYVKGDDATYADLTTAFNEASSALLMLQQDAEGAKVRLEKACAVWKTALDGADINNKKARINKDVAIAISFNLLETYFATGNVNGGQAVLDKLNSISLSSSERKTKYDYDVLYAEIKSRQSK